MYVCVPVNFHAPALLYRRKNHFPNVGNKNNFIALYVGYKKRKIVMKKLECSVRANEKRANSAARSKLFSFSIESDRMEFSIKHHSSCTEVCARSHSRYGGESRFKIYASEISKNAWATVLFPGSHPLCHARAFFLLIQKSLVVSTALAFKLSVRGKRLRRISIFLMKVWFELECSLVQIDNIF